MTLSEKLGYSIVASKGDKFEGKLKEMRSAGELVDKELQTQGTVTNRTTAEMGLLIFIPWVIQLRIRVGNTPSDWNIFGLYPGILIDLRP